MYGKLFASLYQGTLRGRANEILVFTNLIAHADREGFVDKHWRAISEEVGLSVDDVKAACSALEAPDPESRTNVAQGARIQRIDDHRAWGWKIVNYAKYRDIRNEEERRVQNRKAQERFREKVSAPVSNSKQPSASALTVSTVSNSKQPSAAVIIGQHPSAPSAHVDVDVYADTTTPDNKLPLGVSYAHDPRTIQPTMEEAMAHADRIAIPKDCAEKWWLETDARGWMDGRGQAIRNWQSSLQAYGVSWRNTSGKAAMMSGDRPKRDPNADPEWRKPDQP